MEKLILKKCKGYATSFLDKAGKIYDSETDIPLYRTILDANIDNMDGLAGISSNYRITYGDLFKNTDRIADVMTHYGVKPGDSIVEFVMDKITAISIILACSKIGVQAIVAHPRFDDETMAKVIKHNNVKLLLCAEVMYPAFASMNSVNDISRIVVLPMARNYVTDWRNKSVPVRTEVTTWDEFINTKCTCKSEEVKTGDYPLMVCGSTGTTGVPKLIVHTNRSINASITEKKEAGPDWIRGDILLAYPPPYVVSCLACLSFAPLAMGVTIVSETGKGKADTGPNATNEKFEYEFILKHKVNILMTTKSDLLSMVSQCRGLTLDLSHLRHVFVLGEPINQKESKMISDFLASNRCNVILENLYGMSELTSFSYHRYDDDSEISKCSVLPFVTVSAFDAETGEECPYNTVGRIYVKTPAMMKEYMFNKEATDNFFIKDNEGNIWCCTGDIGYVTEDNKVVAHGRYTENFVDANGDIVFPYMISDVLIREDNVVSCKIITKQFGEQKKLVVHVLVKEIPKDLEQYVSHLDEMLRESDTVKVYPDLYKIRTEFPIFHSKISMRDIAMEQDGFIEVPKK